MRQDNFSPTSRYYAVETTELTLDDGRIVRHLRRRFLPAIERFSIIQEHRVAEGERLDHIAAKYLGDAEQSWRLADANGAMHPRELVEEEGRRVKIALPEGIPGASEE